MALFFFFFFLLKRLVDLLIEERIAFPSLSFYISVLTLENSYCISEKKPESIQINANANSHVQDKQTYTASVVRDIQSKEAECKKNNTCLWFCNFMRCKYIRRTSDSGLFASLVSPLAAKALQESCQVSIQNLPVPLQYFCD